VRQGQDDQDPTHHPRPRHAAQPIDGSLQLPAQPAQAPKQLQVRGAPQALQRARRRDGGADQPHGQQPGQNAQQPKSQAETPERGRASNPVPADRRRGASPRVTCRPRGSPRPGMQTASVAVPFLLHLLPGKPQPCGQEHIADPQGSQQHRPVAGKQRAVQVPACHAPAVSGSPASEASASAAPGSRPRLAAHDPRRRPSHPTPPPARACRVRRIRLMMPAAGGASPPSALSPTRRPARPGAQPLPDRQPALPDPLHRADSDSGPCSSEVSHHTPASQGQDQADQGHGAVPGRTMTKRMATPLVGGQRRPYVGHSRGAPRAMPAVHDSQPPASSAMAPIARSQGMPAGVGPSARVRDSR